MSKDYEVGYGKPPKQGQFKPGQSGNPKGRPRQPKSTQAALRQEMLRPVHVRENGRLRTITVQTAILRQLTTKAANGSIPAMRLVLAHLAKPEPPPPVGKLSDQSTEEDEKAIDFLKGVDFDKVDWDKLDKAPASDKPGGGGGSPASNPADKSK